MHHRGGGKWRMLDGRHHSRGRHREVRPHAHEMGRSAKGRRRHPHPHSNGSECHCISWHRWGHAAIAHTNVRHARHHDHIRRGWLPHARAAHRLPRKGRVDEIWRTLPREGTVDNTEARGHRRAWRLHVWLGLHHRRPPRLTAPIHRIPHLRCPLCGGSHGADTSGASCVDRRFFVVGNRAGRLIEDELGTRDRELQSRGIPDPLAHLNRSQSRITPCNRLVAVVRWE
jgi:hypothetical protein